jgi:hypothetical protein
LIAFALALALEEFPPKGRLTQKGSTIQRLGKLKQVYGLAFHCFKDLDSNTQHGALGCKCEPSILIINVPYEYIFYFLLDMMIC